MKSLLFNFILLSQSFFVYGAAEKVCAFCYQDQNTQEQFSLKSCSRCKTTFYCSLECQKNDWRKHKSMCKSFEQKKIEDMLVQKKSPGKGQGVFALEDLPKFEKIVSIEILSRYLKFMNDAERPDWSDLFQSPDLESRKSVFEKYRIKSIEGSQVSIEPDSTKRSYQQSSTTDLFKFIASNSASFESYEKLYQLQLESSYILRVKNYMLKDTELYRSYDLEWLSIAYHTLVKQLDHPWGRKETRPICMKNLTFRPVTGIFLLKKNVNFKQVMEMSENIRELFISLYDEIEDKKIKDYYLTGFNLNYHTQKSKYGETYYKPYFTSTH
ncbi:MAG: hypothetical protein CMP11_07530 [Zetaproteobacteria bacterium]|nr:hypothetical protein [Pseudobdellovibrionaceae bacterium]